MTKCFILFNYYLMSITVLETMNKLTGRLLLSIYVTYLFPVSQM